MRVQDHTTCRDHRPTCGSLALAVRLALSATGTCVALPLAPADAAEPFPTTLELADLQGVNGATGDLGGFLFGDTEDLAGVRVEGVGDINRDGKDDVVVLTSRGSAYVVFGAAAGSGPDIDLAALRPENGGDGEDGFVASPLSASRQSAAAGGVDVNGDGVADFILGDGYSDVDGRALAGISYLVFGRADGFGASLDLNALREEHDGDGSTGVVLKGGVQDLAGTDVALIRDVNGDDINDVLICADGSTTAYGEFAGRAYLLFGQIDGMDPEVDLTDLLIVNGGDGSRGMVINFELPGEGGFIRCAGAGDVNGDGANDVIIGSRGGPPDPERETGGRAIVVFGSDELAAELNVGELLPENGGGGEEGFVLTGARPNDAAGSAVAGIGDLNGDGVDDVAVGAQGANYGAGEVYVLFGKQEPFDPQVELANLLPEFGGDGSAGFVVSGSDVGDSVGASIDGVGDVDGDGLDDLLVSGVYSPGGRSRAGSGYVLYGSTRPFAAVLELLSLREEQGADGSRGFVMNGADAGDLAGSSLARSGDVDGDGTADLIIGAPGAGQAERPESGEAYVVFGRRASVAGEITGFDLATSVCLNRSSGQLVSELFPENTFTARWDCEALGLAADPEDALTLLAQGTLRIDVPAVSGRVLGAQAGARVLCLNRTADRLFTTVTDLGGRWQCAAPALEFAPGDTVAVRIQGTRR
ncbi:MAG: integrin alpha [Pseudomonadota bacterium]